MNFNIELAKSYVQSKEIFPIDFNDAWQWLDFSRKDNALRSFLKCEFVENVDFTRFLNKEETGILIRDIERYRLTIDCFKTWAMMVNTEKGKEVRRYFLECEKQLKSIIQTPPKKAITYYTDRVMDLKHSLIKPPGTWCVIEKCSHLLLEVERLGYQVNQFDLLDGSVGTRWGKYRKGKSWACVGHKATYRFPDNRGERIINAYEYPEIGEFMTWLDYSYEIQCLPGYLEEKYGAIVKI